MEDKKEPMQAQDMMKMFQQKIGNLELTVHALMQVLDEKDVIDQEQVNEQAQSIVKEMQEKDITGEVPSPEEVDEN